MIKCGNKPDLLRQQHTITEHVARHIAHTRNRERLGLNILVELTEMPLHGFPCSTRGNRHALVVVTGRAARCESIVQPEIVRLTDRVSCIREGSCAFVGSNNEIRIVIVMTHDFRRRHNIIVMDVIGDRQKRGDENLIGITTGFEHRIAIAANRQTLRIEAAFGTHWHNHRILDLLGLHKAQDFCAVILCSV